MDRCEQPVARLDEVEYDRRVSALVKQVIDIEDRMTELGFADAVPHLQILRSHIAARSIFLLDGMDAAPDRKMRESA